MGFYSYLIITISLLTIGCRSTHSVNSGLVSEAEVSLVKGGFHFTEGPASDLEGNLYFSDILANKIYRLSTSGNIEQVIQDTEWGNGIFVDQRNNCIYYCQAKGGKISKWSEAEGSQVLVSNTDDITFNGPNDLWLHPSGGIYFSDPNYNRNRDVDIEAVYYFDRGDSSIKIVANDLVRPNGLLGLKNSNILFITDHGDNKTWKYTMLPNGDLGNKELFTEHGGDGMTADERGNVYISNTANSSLDIYSQDGKLLNQISVPEIPSNAAFAGVKRSELYITARTSIYKIRMNVTGQ